jgi:hypothetical protein
MEGYGFNTDEVNYSEFGLPAGKHKVMIVKEEFISNPEKPQNPNMLVVTFQAVEGEYKGKQQVAYYNVNHSNSQTAAIARESVKQIADATKRPVSGQSPLKNRVLQIEVAKQAKSDFMQVSKYFTEEGDFEATKSKKGLVPVTANDSIPE